MLHDHIHIGTSGWSYKGWRGPFYPDKLPSADWLEYYTLLFNTTEINASFYRLPTPETVLNWGSIAPDHFRFCPKMSRYLSHMKKLKDPEEPLQRFFSIFDVISDRLGPILVQLPPQAPFDAVRTGHFFKALRSMYPDYSFVLEVRHNTWMESSALDLLSKYDIGLVISQSGIGFPYAERITGRHIYVRFHGPGRLYASTYTDEMLQDFARKFKKWVAAGHEVWAYFNNDWYAYAPIDALRLQHFCGLT